MKDFEIKCHTVPVDEHQALTFRTEPEVGILSLHASPIRRCPKGINIDGMVVFDLQEDGGVDGIEILYRLRKRIKPVVILPSSREQYWRVYISSTQDEIRGAALGVNVTQREDQIEFRFGSGDVDNLHLVGPCTRVLLMQNRLVGICVDLSNLSQ